MTRTPLTMGCILAAALSAAGPAIAQQPSLSDKIATMVQAARLGDRAAVGVSIVNLADGRTLAAVNADQPLAPASNQKIVTSALALTKLGKSFQFTTRVYLRQGELILVGDYDPTLGDPELAAAGGKSIYEELDAWAKAAARAGSGKPITALRVLSRRGVSDLRHPDWPEDQKQRWYSAPAASLNFHNNCLDVTFAAVTVAGKARTIVPQVAPESRFIDVINEIRPGPRHIWSLKVAGDVSRARVVGTATTASKDPYSVAVDDPPMLLARVLGDRLARAGIEFSGDFGRLEDASFNPDAMAPIAVTKTDLAAVMSRANKRSLNMAAECIFLRACGGWDDAGAAAQALLCSRFKLPEGSLTIRDGSGLSRQDKVSPAAMTVVLSALAADKDAEAFIKSLPISGVDGSLGHRLGDRASKGRVLAKTGTLNGVSALSGYVLSKDARPAIAFSIIVNGTRGDARALEDAICRELVSRLDAAAGM